MSGDLDLLKTPVLYLAMVMILLFNAPLAGMRIL